MRTRLKPESAIFLKSSHVAQEFQCCVRTSRAASLPSFSPRVYSSTMSVRPVLSKTEGVIHLDMTQFAGLQFHGTVTHGSNTNQPPMFTPRSFSEPHAKATPRFVLRNISPKRPENKDHNIPAVECYVYFREHLSRSQTTLMFEQEINLRRSSKCRTTRQSGSQSTLE
jgi:hypothetical protein